MKNLRREILESVGRILPEFSPNLLIAYIVSLCLASALFIILSIVVL
jgi:hypothetical protein